MQNSDVMALAGLIFSAGAFVAAIYAIVRDRGSLVVTGADAGAGQRALMVVNDGLRPVRIERLVVRTGRLARWRGKILPLGGRAAPDFHSNSTSQLPVSVAPAEAVVVHYVNPDHAFGWAKRTRHRLFLQEASGRLHPVRMAPTYRDGQ